MEGGIEVLPASQALHFHRLNRELIRFCYLEININDIFKYTTFFRTLQEVIIFVLSLGGGVHDPSEPIEHMMLRCNCSFVMQTSQTSHMHHRHHINFGLGHAKQQVQK